MSKRIRCIKADIEYDSINKAAKSLNANHIPISKAVNGKQIAAYGMHWEFV